MIEQLLVEVLQTSLSGFYIRAQGRVIVGTLIFGNGGGTFDTFDTFRLASADRRTIGITPMSRAVAMVNIRHDTANFLIAEARTSIAAKAFGLHLELAEAGAVERGSQLHQKAMTVAIDKRIVLLELVDIVRQCATCRPGLGCRSGLHDRHMQHLGLLLVERRRVVAEKAAAVGVFARRIDRYARQVLFDAAADALEGFAVARQQAVDQYKKFDSCAGRTDVSGFHIGQCFCLSQYLAYVARHIVEVSDATLAVTRQVLELAPAFHRSACHAEG